MAKKILKYTIEDKTIAELLGVQNFTNKDSAILELVKNAYDAGSKSLLIQFTGTGIVIKDTGCGMNEKDIEENWMHVGKSSKQYSAKYEMDGDLKRVLAGSKGIGRFALSRLGKKVKLYSQKNDGKSKLVFWHTDWETSILETTSSIDQFGTIIEIEDIRDRWTDNAIKNLQEYLSRTYNDDLMEIVIKYIDKEGKEDELKVTQYFDAPKLGINCLAKINLSYSASNTELTCTISSNEFAEEAQKFCKDTDVKEFSSIINICNEIMAKVFSISKDELKVFLKNLGNFEAELYFNNDVSEIEKEKFLYKHTRLLKRYNSGVILYRNAFSISSYDGQKDWIGFGKRSRKSPAAATHPSGSWRVRENQIAGKIKIDKHENAVLQDLSNRQGLDENTYYELFIEILNKGIAEFERYRQTLIRLINEKNKEEDNPSPISDKIITNPKCINALSEQEVKQLVEEIKDFKNESASFKKQKNDVEQRYKYDIRILNTLATVGLKASSIAHEMHNDRNNIAENYDNIVEALKKYGVWDIVDAPDKKKHIYSNIPELLSQNKKVNAKIVLFMDTMLTEIERKRFWIDTLNVYDLLNSLCQTWMTDFAWVNIKLELSKDCIFRISEDVINVIFDNLILNSIQQNEKNTSLLIVISVKEQDDFLEFFYSDEGKGLPEKYLKKPRKILEVHETSRDKGHGLGMWIVNNTVVMSGGEVLEIEGDDGFKIKFKLGEKYYE